MYKDVEDKQRTRELTEPDVYCPSSVYQDCKCGYTQEDLGEGLGNSEAFCDCQLSVYASAVESRLYTVVVCVVLVMVTACFLKFFLKCLGDPLTTFFSSKLSFGLDKRASSEKQPLAPVNKYAADETGDDGTFVVEQPGNAQRVETV